MKTLPLAHTEMLRHDFRQNILNELMYNSFTFIFIPEAS